MLIESGIPLPSMNKNKYGKFEDVISKMKLMDSILFAECEWNTMNALRHAIVKNGGRVATRSEGSGTRLWLTKEIVK